MKRVVPQAFLSFSATHILLVILFLASFLRLVGLENYPSGFHGDEASFLLNTKALIATGRDEDNQLFPLYIRSFIDPQPALYSYFQIPFVTVLGTTHTAARLPAALFGILSVYMVYVLVRRLSNQQTGLVTAFLLSISPWHIMLSRGSQQVILAFVFGLVTILLVLFLIEKKKLSLYLGLFLLSFFLTLYLYHSAKIVLPLLLGYLFVTHYKDWKKERIFWTVLIASSIFVTAFGSVITGFTRYSAVSIFTNPQIQLLLDEKIRTATFGAPYILIRLFSNKAIDYGLAMLANYSDYFTMRFLFLQGGQPQRYVIPFHGLLYIVEAVLLFVGLWSTKYDSNKKITFFFLFWLLIAPLPGALTTEEVPSMTRTFFMLAPLLFFVAKGVLLVWNSQQKALLGILIRTFICMVYFFSFAYFLFTFFIFQPYYHPWHRDYGSEQLPQAIQAYMDRYDRITISTNQYVYFTLQNALSLSEIQQHFPKRLQKVSTYGKITFVNDDCVYVREENVLSVVKGYCKLSDQDKDLHNFTEVGRVSYKDIVPAYVFVEYKKPKE